MTSPLSGITRGWEGTALPLTAAHLMGYLRGSVSPVSVESPALPVSRSTQGQENNGRGEKIPLPRPESRVWEPQSGGEHHVLIQDKCLRHEFAYLGQCLLIISGALHLQSKSMASRGRLGYEI